MADKSAIEWTDATWNPIRARNKKTGKVGWHCEHATTGCEFCYAEGFNKRLGTGLAFKPGHRKDVEIFLDEEMLTQPLRWKKPRMIFPNSMTDLFADFVPDEWIDRIFAVMALTPQHTYQPLTKRAQRMQDYCSTIQKNGRWLQMEDIALQLGYEPRGAHDHGFDWISHKQFLPNVWLGVSTERQEEANERIPLLLMTPAAVRFISAEPLLAPMDLTVIRYRNEDCDVRWNSLTSEAWVENGDSASAYTNDAAGNTKLDWVIVGGESGKNARPMHPDWARTLRNQCAAASVPFFFKQWGEWLPGEANYGQFNPRPMNAYRRCDNHSYEWPDTNKVQNFGTNPDDVWSGNLTARRIGKKAAGRLLDGELYNARPAVQP